jgi:MFS family permease
VMGIWGMSTSMASVLGPSVGGFIVQYLGWQYIFFMNVPFAVLSGIAIFLLIESDWHKPPSFHFDYLGAFVLAAMIVSLIAGLQAGSEDGWGSPRAMIMLSTALVCLPLFKRIEQNCCEPVVELKMFTNLSFLSAVYCGSTHLIAIQGMQFIMPIYLSTVKGFDAVKIGLMLMPQALIRLVVSPIAGMLEDRYGSRVPVAAGLVLRTAGLVFLGLLTPSSTNTTITLALLLDGIGAALVWSPSLNAAINSSPKEMASSATGLFNMIRLIMASTSMVLVGLAMDKLFTGVPEDISAPVPGFFQVYMAFAIVTALGLLTVRYLEVRTPEDERVRLLHR